MKNHCWDCPDGLAVKTSHFHCRGHENSYHKTSKGYLKSIPFLPRLGGEKKLGPLETSELSSFPSLLILSGQPGSRAAWEEAEALGSCDGLMPRRVQVCWAPKLQKEEPSKSWMEHPSRHQPLLPPTCERETREGMRERVKKARQRVLP